LGLVSYGAYALDIGTDNRTAKALFVFVEAPNDPNAPTITAPNCNGG
jgi:hypothetical protein